MPICQNCETKWTWKQTIRTLFKLRCPYCEKKQYESASSRLRNQTLVLLPLVLLLPINTLFDFSLATAIIIAIIGMLAIFGIYPFMLRLSSEEEPYW